MVSAKMLHRPLTDWLANDWPGNIRLSAIKTPFRMCRSSGASPKVGMFMIVWSLLTASSSPKGVCLLRCSHPSPRSQLPMPSQLQANPASFASPWYSEASGGRLGLMSVWKAWDCLGAWKSCSCPGTTQKSGNGVGDEPKILYLKAKMMQNCC